VVAAINRALALSRLDGPAAGLEALEAVSADPRLADYQPYWAARGHLLKMLNKKSEAQEAFTRAASLTDDPALRDYLFKRVSENA